MPEISIVVPVYKVENLLARCVDSILNQTFQDFELILVDDGSPDGSGIICDSYARTESRIRVIHKENGGLSSARNAGIEIARGEYLCFVDSDDLIHPQMLELLRNALLEHAADIASTRYISFSTETVPFESTGNIHSSLLLRQDFIDNLYPENFERIGISAWGKLYRRELFDKLRYPEGKIYEDLHIYLSLLQQCQRIAVLDQPLYYYYLGNVSITKSNYLAHCRFDEFIVRLEHVSYFRSCGMRRQYHYALNDYLTFFFRNAFAVLLKYPQIKKDFARHMQNHRKLLPALWRNPYVCRARKLCGLLIHIHPSFAAKLAQRCIPECLLEEMRHKKPESELP